MIRIVIVDDHPVLRQGIKLMLDAYPDMQVIGVAGDGGEAIKLARELSPDLMLMDIQMPGINGIQACEQIHKQQPAIKLLVLSQIDTVEHLVAVLRGGASGYVLKQTAEAELTNAIHVVMNGQVYLTPAMQTQFVQLHFRQIDEKKSPAHQLTPREQEVVRYISDGMTNQEIADAMHLSIKTVQTHRSNIMEKLDLHDRVDLVKYAITHGLVDLKYDLP